MRQPQDKAALVRAAYALNNQRHGGNKSPLCLAASFLAVVEASKIPGFEIQAGSAYFRCALTGDKQHFGYSYNEDEATKAVLFDDKPILHIWVLDTDEPEAPAVVDLTTGYKFEEASSCGVPWVPELIMEKHFWGVPDGENKIYSPSSTATQLAYLMALGISLR